MRRTASESAVAAAAATLLTLVLLPSPVAAQQLCEETTGFVSLGKGNMDFEQGERRVGLGWAGLAEGCGRGQHPQCRRLVCGPACGPTLRQQRAG